MPVNQFVEIIQRQRDHAANNDQHDRAQLYAQLRRNKQPAELRIVNGKHEWPVWESTIGDALKYVFRTVRRPQADN